MTFGGNVRRRQATLRRHSRVAVVVTLGCLVVGGLAGCEYAPLEPLASLTPTPTPPVDSQRSPEEQEAFDARLAELTADVEEQLGAVREAMGGGPAGMKPGSGMSIGTQVSESGDYTVLTACSPSGQATLSINPRSGPEVTAVVPCGERTETPVQLGTGWVSISLEPLESGVSVGAIYLLPPGVSSAAETTQSPAG